RQKAYRKPAALRGPVLFNREDNTQAGSFCEKSLSIPVVARYTALASFWAGEAYSALGRHQDATRHYTAVLNHGGSDHVGGGLTLATAARYGLGYAYYNLKDYERARMHFREYVNATDRRKDRKSTRLNSSHVKISYAVF